MKSVSRSKRALNKWENERLRRMGVMIADKEGDEGFNQRARKHARDYLKHCTCPPEMCKGLLDDSVELALKMHWHVAVAADHCSLVNALPPEPLFQTTLQHVTEMSALLTSLPHATNSSQAKDLSYALDMLRNLAIAVATEKCESTVRADSDVLNADSFKKYEELWKETQHIHGGDYTQSAWNSTTNKEVDALQVKYKAMFLKLQDSMSELLERLDASQSVSTIPYILSEVKAFYSHCLSDIAAFGHQAIADNTDVKEIRDCVNSFRFQLYLVLACHSYNASPRITSMGVPLELCPPEMLQVALDTFSDYAKCLRQVLSNTKGIIPKKSSNINNSNNSNSSNNSNNKTTDNDDEHTGRCVPFCVLIDAMEEAIPQMLIIIKEHPHVLILAKLTNGVERLLFWNTPVAVTAGETNARSYHKLMMIGEHMCQVLGHCYLCHKASSQPTTNNTNNNTNNTNTNTNNDTATATATNTAVVIRACSACHITPYCSTECQSGDWTRHKLVCKQHASFSY